MNENKIYLKVAQDMYLSQFFWTISFLGILLFISIVRLLLGLQGDEAEGFLTLFLSQAIFICLSSGYSQFIFYLILSETA